MDRVFHTLLLGICWGYLLLSRGWMLSLVLWPLISLIHRDRNNRPCDKSEEIGEVDGNFATA